MTHPLEPSSQPINRRRKLLRATLSAPVVLTVYSGSAAAGASTLCLANAQTNPTTKTVITAASDQLAQSTDSFVRVRLYVAENGKYFLKGGDLGSNVDTSEIPVAGKWRRFDIGTPPLTATSNKFDKPIRDTAPAGATLSDKYAAVRYDATGKVVGIGASGTGSAITQSCWHSFPSP